MQPEADAFDAELSRPLVARWVKRGVDIVGALVGLIVLAPLLLLVSVLVKATSPGPALYRQRRAGKAGAPFYCLKFRTMRNDADAQKHLLLEKNELSGPVFKIKNDPRITPLGRVLRKTSLDELPQLWNVLVGEMSLVGPRPPSLDEVTKYRPHHHKRLGVRPGITGLWQVSGRAEIGDFEKWVELDVRYIETWSLALDAKILLRTIPAVLSTRGAA